MKTILSWVVGIASVAFVLLLMVIIFGNLSGNTGIPDSTTTLTVTNESFNPLVYVNASNYTLSVVNASTSGYTVTAVIADYNQSNGSADSIAGTPTGYNVTLDSANYSMTTAGVLWNPTDYVFPNVSVSYTYTYTYTSTAEVDAENVIGNYTAGAVNTSEQFPTIGTILGVAALILILLALLVFVITRMSGTSVTSGGKSEFSQGGNFA